MDFNASKDLPNRIYLYRDQKPMSTDQPSCEECPQHMDACGFCETCKKRVCSDCKLRQQHEGHAVRHLDGRDTSLQEAAKNDLCSTVDEYDDVGKHDITSPAQSTLGTPPASMCGAVAVAISDTDVEGCSLGLHLSDFSMASQGSAVHSEKRKGDPAEQQSGPADRPCPSQQKDAARRTMLDVEKEIKDGEELLKTIEEDEEQTLAEITSAESSSFKAIRLQAKTLQEKKKEHSQKRKDEVHRGLRERRAYLNSIQQIGDGTRQPLSSQGSDHLERGYGASEELLMMKRPPNTVLSMTQLVFRSVERGTNLLGELVLYRPNSAQPLPGIKHMVYSIPEGVDPPWPPWECAAIWKDGVMLRLEVSGWGTSGGVYLVSEGHRTRISSSKPSFGIWIANDSKKVYCTASDKNVHTFDLKQLIRASKDEVQPERHTDVAGSKELGGVTVDSKEINMAVVDRGKPSIIFYSVQGDWKAEVEPTRHSSLIHWPRYAAWNPEGTGLYITDSKGGERVIHMSFDPSGKEESRLMWSTKVEDPWNVRCAGGYVFVTTRRSPMVVVLDPDDGSIRDNIKCPGRARGVVEGDDGRVVIISYK